MKIRKYCTLAKLHAGDMHPIDESFAELKLIRAAVRGDAEGAAALFGACKQFTNLPCAIDTPYKRYEGIEGVKRFAEEFLAVFHADSAEIIPVIQTRAGGRSVTELQLDMVIDGMIDQVPMFVVADLRDEAQLDEVRIYFRFAYVEGLQAYRRPLFTPAHLEVNDPDLLSGAVREYFYALHTAPHADVERILNCTDPVCQFGGYEIADQAEYDAAHWPETSDEIAQNADYLRQKYTRMSAYIPNGVAMRFETVIDDGKNAVLEWIHIISKTGQEKYGRIAMGGVSSYERGSDGRLRSIRICDYAGQEGTIDWSRTDTTLEAARKVHVVPVFPSGVGQKK